MKLFDWEVLTIGILSRNRYWGESDSSMYHPVLATSTLIYGDGKVILVDPSEPYDLMSEKLYRYSGIRPEQVDIIFSTHYHGDHRVDASRYPNAACYMSQLSMLDFEKAERELAEGKGPASFVEGVRGVYQAVPGDELIPGVSLFALPGHTAGCTGLLFNAKEGRVLVTGDTIMGVEYFEHCNGYWFSDSIPETRKSIRNAAKAADWIIPGHGDVFSVKAHMPAAGEEETV